jgi:hypothetical protein
VDVEEAFSKQNLQWFIKHKDKTMKRILVLALVVTFLSGTVGTGAYAQGRQAQAPTQPTPIDEQVRLPSDAAPLDQEGEKYKGYDELPPFGTVIFDAGVVRPLGVAACALGVVGSVVFFPFAAFSKSQSTVHQKLLKEPFEYTFKRPLGEDLDP